jgi:hypothetical protein
MDLLRRRKPHSLASINCWHFFPAVTMSAEIVPNDKGHLIRLSASMLPPENPPSSKWVRITFQPS